MTNTIGPICKPQIFFSFFIFNCYRLGIGIESEYGCTEGLDKTTTLTVFSEAIDTNSTLKSYDVFAVDAENNETTLIGNAHRHLIGSDTRFTLVIDKFGLISYQFLPPGAVS